MEEKIQQRLRFFEELKKDREKEIFAINSIIVEMQNLLTPAPQSDAENENKEESNG